MNPDVARSLEREEEYRVRDTDRSADGDREPDRLGSRGHEPGDPGTPEWLENQQRAAAAMSEGVVRSLTEAQRRDLQGEAVGDREPREPVTEAGRQYIEAVSADTWSLDGRVAWARRFVLAIEDEAALLARPVEPEPQTDGRKHCVYRGCVRRDGHEGEHHVTAQTLEAIEHAGYERGLLARRAPGDREREPLLDRERLKAAFLVAGNRADVYTDDHMAEAVAAEYERLTALRRALAADSRPEQRTWPSRDEFSRMSAAEVNDYLASIGVSARVAVDSRPEQREPLDVERLARALCAVGVGHYRGWDVAGMGEAAHMGMADGTHRADAEDILRTLEEGR